MISLLATIAASLASYECMLAGDMTLMYVFLAMSILNGLITYGKIRGSND